MDSSILNNETKIWELFDLAKKQLSNLNDEQIVCTGYLGLHSKDYLDLNLKSIVS